MLAYGFPLGGLTIALALGWAIAGPLNDWTGVLTGMSGLGVGWWLGHLALRRRACSR